MKTFLTYHLPWLAYAAIILMVSSIPNLHTPHVQFVQTDKVAHFSEYAIFAFLAFRSVAHLTPNMHNNRTLLVAFLALAIFAVFDEYLQSFTPGRDPDPLDYLADVIGGSLVLALTWLRRRRRLRESPADSGSSAQ